MIRITGGKWKGRSLKTPAGLKVRPTRSMVREAIFNMLGRTVINARVLDLFAGTGLLGLEAISRGARETVFVEQDNSTCKTLKKNIQTLEAEQETTILCKDASYAITFLKHRKKLFNIILVDPPYKLPISPVLNKLSSAGIIAFDGWLIIERGKGQIIAFPETMRETHQKKYGDTMIHILQNFR
jgi:16S rRNA (guanine966-N2)-methyltransferase